MTDLAQCPRMVIKMVQAAGRAAATHRNDGTLADASPSTSSSATDQTPMAVRAVCEVGEVWFDLPKSATIAQLIEKLAQVAAGHGSPITIEVLLEPLIVPS